MRTTFAITAALLCAVSAQPPSGPASCPDGTTYDANRFYCAVCLAGSFCPGSTPPAATVTSCDRGWYSDEGATSCSPCPAGTYGGAGYDRAGLKACNPCPAGTYQPYSNISSSGQGWNDVYNSGKGGADDTCLSCPQGTFSSSPGSASCDGLIPANIWHTWSPNVYTRVMGDTSAAGYYDLSLSCPGGFECGLGPDRRSCGPGNYSKNGDGFCSQCPLGTFQTQPGQTRCGSCSTGGGQRQYYIDIVGSSSASDCKACASGFYALDKGYNSANIFEPIFDAPEPVSEGAADCKRKCPLGKVDNPGSFVLPCVTCPQNQATVHPWYNPMGSTGTSLSANIDIISAWNVTCSSFCPPGTYLKDFGANQYFCDICYGNAQYCPGGPVDTTAMTPAMVSCPAVTVGGNGGTVETTFAAKSAADCFIKCTTQSDCTHDGNADCEVPRPGYGLDRGSMHNGDNKCVSCDILIEKGYGTPTTVSGGSAQNRCQRIQAGQGWVTNTTFDACPSGYYCPLSSQLTPNGRYTPYKLPAFVPPIPCGPDATSMTDDGKTPYGPVVTKKGTKCVPNTCPPGTTYDAALVECSKTATGSYPCFDKEGNALRRCPGGSVADILVTQGELCSDNGGGTPFVPSSNATVCVPDHCAPGFYRSWMNPLMNGTRCLRCPSASHLVCTGGTAGIAVCHPNAINADDKGVPNSDRTLCECPAGQMRLQYQGCKPIPTCTTGQWLNTQYLQCMSCSDSEYCPDNVNKYTCPSGLVSATNRTVCISSSSGSGGTGGGGSGCPPAGPATMPTCTLPMTAQCISGAWTCSNGGGGMGGGGGGSGGCLPGEKPNMYATSPSSSLCVPCGSGSGCSCPNGVQVCAVSPMCAAGDFLQPNGNDCMPCFPGFSCPGGYTAPVADPSFTNPNCPVGQYGSNAPGPNSGPSTTLTCTPCVPGSTCEGGNKFFVGTSHTSSGGGGGSGGTGGGGGGGGSSCPDGQKTTQAMGGGVTCVPCYPGCTCTNGFQMCLVSPMCDPGYFLSLSGNDCKMCPAGFSCAGGYVAPVGDSSIPNPNCLAGQFAAQVMPTNGNAISSFTCTNCMSGASAICEGGNKWYVGTPKTGGGGGAPAPSPSPTPSNSPSSSPLPPPEQELLMAYSLSSAEMCSSGSVVSKFLAANGPAVAMRASFAASLGYNTSDAFITSLLVCDGTYVPVARDAPANLVDPSSPNSTNSGSSSEAHHNTRMLFNPITGSISSNTNSNTLLRKRRLVQLLNQLNITVDNTTVVVELGVSIPSSLVAPMSAYLSAVLNGGSSSTIAAAALAVQAAFASLNTQFPGTAAMVPDMLLQNIDLSTSGSPPLSFTSDIEDVAVAAVAPLVALLNISSTSFTTNVVASSIRGGAVAAPNNAPVAPVVAPAAGSDDSKSGSGALGALVLIPIAGIVLFFLWRRRQQQKKTNSSSNPPKSVDGEEAAASGFTSVAAPSDITLDEENMPGKKKSDFAPTSTAKGSESEFAQSNPMQGNLVIRRATNAPSAADANPTNPSV